MVLKQTVIQRILDKDGELSLDLAKALGFTQFWVQQLARNNKVNGPLTTAAALEVIRKSTKLPDREILEREPENERGHTIA